VGIKQILARLGTVSGSSYGCCTPTAETAHHRFYLWEWAAFLSLFTAVSYYTAFTLGEDYFLEWFVSATVSLMMSVWFFWLCSKYKNHAQFDKIRGDALFLALFMPHAVREIWMLLSGWNLASIPLCLITLFVCLYSGAHPRLVSQAKEPPTNVVD
jgi:hypothetical protein